MSKRSIQYLISTLLLTVILAAPLQSVEIKTSAMSAAPRSESGLSVSVRVMRGDGAVFSPGERISLSFQTNEDAYVILYNIDSEGYVSLLHPSNGVLKRSKANTVYFLPENGSGQYWTVEGQTGVEYIHAIAVTSKKAVREEELKYLSESRRVKGDDRLKIDGDPYLAFNVIDENIIVSAKDDPPATDHTSFFINREVDYPRYLCSKCHAPGKLTDPYNMDCPEIVVERFAYENEPQYPYPPLFDITYVTGGTNDDYYVSGDYAEKYYDDGRKEDIDIYLSIYYPNYSYPHRYYYYPYYHVSYYDPFWWDYYWYWDFGFSGFYVGYYYYYWPFRTWYYPSYYYSWYYPCYYCYPYYGWPCYDYCYYPPKYDYPVYRTISSDRTLVKQRSLDYTSTQTAIMRDKAITGSGLMRSKTRDTADRSASRSDGRNASSTRAGSRSYDTDLYRSSLKSRSDIVVRGGRRSQSDTPAATRKEVVHGIDRSKDAVRSSRSGGSRSSGTVRRSDDRSTGGSRSSNPRSGAVKRSGGESRSSGADRTRSDSKQVERKSGGSSSTTRNERNADGTRKSSGSKSRKSSAGSRSSGSSSAARSGSSGGRSSGSSRSSGGSGKSRRK